MKKVYLDVCALCRPFDDQDYIRIRLETDAVNLILANVKNNNYELMRSKVHDVEIQAISDKYEQYEVFKLLEKYAKTIKADSGALKRRIEELVGYNFGIADAAHVSFSEFDGSTFISCDDKLIKKCERHITEINCFNPLSFCELENLK